MPGEGTPLLAVQTGGTVKLPLLFSVICLIDLLGVFPIVVLPRAIIDCGWIGIPMCLVVFVLEIYTAVLLGRSWIIASEIQPDIVSKSRYPYAALGELAYGPAMRKCATVLLDICMFSASVPNLLFVSQSLQLLGAKTSVGYMSFCKWLPLLGLILCPIMWLGSPKDLKWLSIVSACSVVTVTMLTLLCMAEEPSGAFPVQPSSPTWESIFFAFGIMVFLFELHPTVLILQVDMKDKYAVGNAIFCCFVVMGGLSLATSIIAEGKFGDVVRPNILEHLSGSGALYVDIFIMSLQIFLSMAVAETALFQDIEDQLQIPREFCWQRCVVRSVVVVVAVLIAELVPRFDLIMGVIGGAITCPLVFLFPPMFYGRLRRMQRARFQQPRMSASVSYSADSLEEQPSSSSASEEVPRAPSVEDGDNTWFAACVGYLLRDCAWLSVVQQPEELTAGEKALLLLVMFIGGAGTLLASYFSLHATIVYGEFAPPCFL